MIDIEADYWKDIFVHLLHKNMVRTNAQILRFSDSKKAFEDFELAHPEYNPEITMASSYCTWEIFVTPGLKLRLYIQNQIKASLLQKDGKDFVKICDARFPYNPFPEINEFLKNKNTYLVELEHNKQNFEKINRQIKIAGEFLKANLEIKLKNKKNIQWHIETKNEKLSLFITKNNEEKEYIVNPGTLMADLEKILENY